MYIDVDTLYAYYLLSVYVLICSISERSLENTNCLACVLVDLIHPEKVFCNETQDFRF